MFVRWTNLTLTDEEQRRLPGYRDEAVVRRFDAPEALDIRFYEVRARSVLNRVPDRAMVPFRWTVNPYRGCTHACVYCFARPTHRYLDLDAGRDFEREIVVKVNAPEALAQELARPSWKREHVALGTNTDPYQWVEARYRLMPGIWRAMLENRTPCSVLTKSPLVLRDIDILAELAGEGLLSAAFSIPTLDERGVARDRAAHAEPRGAPRSRRPPDRGGRPHQRPGRAADARHQRRSGRGPRDRAPRTRSRRAQRHADRASPARRRPRGLHGLARAGAAGARRALHRALRPRRLPADRRAPSPRRARAPAPGVATTLRTTAHRAFDEAQRRADAPRPRARAARRRSRQPSLFDARSALLGLPLLELAGEVRWRRSRARPLPRAPARGSPRRRRARIDSEATSISPRSCSIARTIASMTRAIGTAFMYDGSLIAVSAYIPALADEAGGDERDADPLRGELHAQRRAQSREGRTSSRCRSTRRRWPPSRTSEPMKTIDRDRAPPSPVPQRARARRGRAG